MDWFLYDTDLRHEGVQDYLPVFSGNIDSLAKTSECLSTMFSAVIYNMTVEVLRLNIWLDGWKIPSDDVTLSRFRFVAFSYFRLSTVDSQQKLQKCLTINFHNC